MLVLSQPLQTRPATCFLSQRTPDPVFAFCLPVGLFFQPVTTLLLPILAILPSQRSAGALFAAAWSQGPQWEARGIWEIRDVFLRPKI